MANCAICEKPVTAGLVIDSECLDEKLAKLRAYEQAEKDGTLIRLPLAPGEKLHFVALQNKDIYKIAEFTGHIGLYWTTCSDIGNYVPLGVIGKTVFTSEQDALAAIREV